jgi:multicomponent Na+:H+ antiporter subunit A
VTLADFRGLDTMVEITVLFVAIVGVAALLRHGRSW